MAASLKHTLIVVGIGVTLIKTGACIVPDEKIIEPEPCPAVVVAPARNPATGACEIRDGWTCEEDGPTMEPQPLGEVWASCGTGCEQLEGIACQQTAGCQLAYVDADGGYDYLGEEPLACWAVIPDFAVAGDCLGLDAWSCATRDDCRPVYWPATDVTPAMPPYQGEMWFAYCAAELPANDPGVCYPTGSVCEVDPPNCPIGTLPGVVNNCWSGYCIPLEACEEAPACEGLGEATCLTRSDCDALYVACDPNEDCNYKFYGCITN